MPRLRSRLSYANVMATIAVFIALGGSSYAALRVTSGNVPKNALTGADIKNLTGKDVRNNTLTGKDVKGLGSGDVANGKLLAEDFAAGQLPQGPPGQPGAPAATIFGYVAVGQDDSAQLMFGKGIVSAQKLEFVSEYEVVFNRSVAGCAVMVSPGIGRPTPDGSGLNTDTGLGTFMSNDGRSVSVNYSPDPTSFFIAAFC